MNCRMVKTEIKAFIDGELGPMMRWRVRRHLSSCAGCQMEAKSMTDLTSQAKNLTDITSPSGLREKVLGKLNFEPAGRTGLRWPYKTRPIAVVGLLAFTIVAAAVVMPMFEPAKMQSRQVATLAKTPTADAKDGIVENAPAGTLPPAVEPSTKRYEISISPKRMVKRNAQPILSMPVAPRDGLAPSAIKPYNPQLMIIKNAELTVLVKDFSKANDEAIFAAKSVGGFVTDSSVSSDEGAAVSGSVCLQVPVDSFEQAIEKLSKLGKVTAKNITGEDVTGEVVDIESRLRNKRAEERQYLEIMNRANRIGDIMNVSNELYRVRGEIEEMTGRVKQLKTSAAMSTINLTLTEKPKPKSAPMGFIQKSFMGAVASLAGTLSRIAGILIWLLVYSPFWALPVAGYLYLRRRTPVATTTEA